MNTKAEPKSSRTKRRIFLFGTFVLLVLAGILLAIPMTPWGLSRLTPALESRFSDHLDLDVRIQGLALHWPLAASVDAFSATDATGELRLGVRKARVRISLRQLLRKHILIHRLEADEILFAGLPGPETETEAKTWEFPLQLPDLEGLFDLVELRHLDIKRLVLPPPLLPEPHVFSLKGQWRARELSLDSTWISRGEHPFAEKPHMRITLRLNAFNVEHIRNLVLEMQAGSFAKLIPDWPEDLPDTMEMQLTLCETRHKKVEVLTGQLRTAPVQIDVDGELSLETGMLKLAARAAIPDLSRLQAWCPVPLAGTLQTGLTLTGRIEDPEMTATLLSDAVQLAGYDFRVHHIRHRGKLLPLARRGHLEAFIEYQDLPVRLETGFSFENGNLGLTEFSLATDGFDLATNLSAQFAPLAVQGRIMATASDFSPMGKLFGRDLTGDARLQADLSVEDGVQSVVLNEWAVNWDGLEIIAESPLLIVMEPDRFRFSPWTLRVGRGRLLAEGSMEGKRPKLKVEILDLPLDRFGFAGRMDPGTELNGQFTLSGTLLDPDATLQLDLRGLRPEDPELWDGPPARFRVDLALLEKRLQGAFRLENLPGEPVTLDLDIPAPLSLAPFSFQWPPEGPVEARFSANTDLAGL